MRQTLIQEGVHTKPKWPNNNPSPNIPTRRKQAPVFSTATFPTARQRAPPTVSLIHKHRKGRAPSPPPSPTQKTTKRQDLKKTPTKVALATPAGPIRATFKNKRTKLQFMKMATAEPKVEGLDELDSKYKSNVKRVKLMSPTGWALRCSHASFTC